MVLSPRTGGFGAGNSRTNRSPLCLLPSKEDCSTKGFCIVGEAAERVAVIVGCVTDEADKFAHALRDIPPAILSVSMMVSRTPCKIFIPLSTSSPSLSDFWLQYQMYQANIKISSRLQNASIEIYYWVPKKS